MTHEKGNEPGLDATLASLRVALGMDHICEFCLSEIKKSISQLAHVRPLSGSRGFYQGWKGIRVSPQEYKLLELLFQNRERPISTSELVARLWGPLDRPSDPEHALRMLVMRLRTNKLADSPWTIETKGRRGYQLTRDVEEPEQLEPTENLEDDPWLEP